MRAAGSWTPTPDPAVVDRAPEAPLRLGYTRTTDSRRL